MICHVALCTPPYATLSYLTPEEFPDFPWQAGLRVAVPLGNGAIRAGVVTAVFAEPQYPESAANIIAEESGIRVWLLDPVVTGPDDKDAYLDAMEQNLQVLEEALS